MSSVDKSGTYKLGNRTVHRIGYGAMQLAGKGVFGPAKDHDAAIAVLREAVAQGVNHIDTSDYYGPYVTNKLIREALSPYPDDLTIVTKIGARRGEDASWLPAFTADELEQAVHDNLRNLGLEVMDVVNLRIMFGVHGPAEGSIEAQVTKLAELQRKGLVRHIGLSNVTRAQIAEGRRICDIVCVQNQYNLAHRDDDALSTNWRAMASPMCRSSRSAASARCNRRRYPVSPNGLARRRCRWRWRGCCSARRTSC
jgi:aryl-alcohol dehydrogenase-like predicted oxidoreductase